LLIKVSEIVKSKVFDAFEKSALAATLVAADFLKALGRPLRKFGCLQPPAVHILALQQDYD
jgi:D-alanyl-D-alanine dipeptidase